jgi:hypothetical protein
VIDETGKVNTVGKIIPLCLTINVPDIEIEVIEKISVQIMLCYLPRTAVLVKTMDKRMYTCLPW